MLSDSPPERDVEWTASGAEAAYKHLARVYRIATEVASDTTAGDQQADHDLTRACAICVDGVTRDIESFGFNAAIGKLYAFTATIAKSKAGGAAKRESVKKLSQLMSPMTPHLSEDIWSMLGGEGLVTLATWPVADADLLRADRVILPIQINGKRRGELEVDADLDKSEVEKLALAHQAVQKALDGGTPKKVIVVPGRIVNVVV